MKKITIIFLASFISLVSFAQEETQNEKVSLLNVKFNMLELFNPIPSYQFSVEYGLGGQLSLQHDLGFITNYAPIYALSDKQLTGIRTKNEIRYYLNNQKAERRFGAYTSAEIMWNYYKFVSEEEFAMDNWTYFEMKEVTRYKNVFAFHQKYGYQFQFSNSKAVFDVYIGAGIRSVYKKTELPTNGELNTTGINFNLFDGIGNSSDGNSIVPSFSLGYKLGIFLEK